MGMIKLPSQSIDFFNQNYLDIFESGNLAEGEWNKTLQSWICQYTSAQYSQLTCSNGSGLLTVLSILKRYRGYKYIFIQANTMYGVQTIAKTSGLEYIGEAPCSIPLLMPTFNQVKEFIGTLSSPSETVFLLTHIGGWTNPDIEEIAQYCKDKGVALVEDCAHSLGSTLNGKHTGLYGVAGVYSLYATKAIPAGEGGIIVSNDKELSEYIAKFVIYDRFEQKMDIGVNFRLSELSALLAYSVVKETEHIIENKYAIANFYSKACKKSGLEFIEPRLSTQRSNLYKFILISDNPERDFNAIKTRTSSVYNYTLGDQPDDPITTNHICLPIWYGLESAVVERVLSEINNCSVTV